MFSGSQGVYYELELYVYSVKCDTNLACYLHCHWNLQDSCICVKKRLGIFG